MLNKKNGVTYYTNKRTLLGKVLLSKQTSWISSLHKVWLKSTTLLGTIEIDAGISSFSRSSMKDIVFSNHETRLKIYRDKIIGYGIPVVNNALWLDKHSRKWHNSQHWGIKHHYTVWFIKLGTNFKPLRANKQICGNICSRCDRKHEMDMWDDPKQLLWKCWHSRQTKWDFMKCRHQVPRIISQ